MHLLESMASLILARCVSIDTTKTKIKTYTYRNFLQVRWLNNIYHFMMPEYHYFAEGLGEMSDMTNSLKREEGVSDVLNYHSMRCMKLPLF